MNKRAAVCAFLLPVLFGLGLASPDLGLDITINLVTTGNPNLLSTANVVNSVTSDLQGAIGGYQVPKLNGSTSLIVAGESLVTLVSQITGTVNQVLRNISVIASQRQTAPSCMFASVNATIDAAYTFLDTAPTLIKNIQNSTSEQNGSVLNSTMTSMMESITEIAGYLDTLYKQVAVVVAAGTVTSNSVTTNIKESLLIDLMGAVSVTTTTQKALSTTIRNIRSSFEQSNNALTSFNNDLAGVFNSVNNTQRDYYNQVVNRITSFQSKVSSDTKSGTTEILSTITRLNPFVQNIAMRNESDALVTAIKSLNVSLVAVGDDYSKKIMSQLTQVYIGTESFVQSNVVSLVAVINASNFGLAATLALGGPFAGNCNGKYGGSITNLENNMRDILNRALNEYANTGYTDAFISEYNQVMREQTRYINNRINFCLNLGSVTSNAVTRAGILRCFTETVLLIDTLLKDYTFETQVAIASINLEGLAMIQRLESTASILNHGLVAKAAKLDELLANCQKTNS